MHKHVEVSARPAARWTKHSDACAFQPADGAMKVWHPHRDVVKSGSALLQKLCDRGAGIQGLEQFNPRSPRREHGDIHLLVLDGLAREHRQAKVRGVERERLINRSNRDTEM